ncbi:MAG: CRISPR system precrRNA processing endoribonuclease RAMP protein Cas6 [Cyanobacteria bacterium J06623_4]
MRLSVVEVNPRKRASNADASTVRWTKTHQLVGIALQLCPERSMTLPNKIATALHGWLLEQVGEHDAALSAQLHDNQAEKSFVISGILGPDILGGDVSEAVASASVERRGDRIFLQAGKPYQVIITGLSKPVCHWLKVWVNHLPNRIQFRRGSYLPITGWEIAHTPTTYSQLLKTTKQPADSLTLSFLSPTSFRSRGSHLPLPLPRNIFHSFLRRWNNFAAKSIPEEAFLDWVENSVTILHYSLRTEKTAVAKAGLVTGFVGTVKLGIQPKAQRNEKFSHYFHVLSGLAPYCGTGHKTTFGLGQTRLGALPEGRAVEQVVVEKAVDKKQRETVLIESVETMLVTSTTDERRLVQQYAQTALRIEALKQHFLQNRQQGGDRAARKAVTMATILARREAGESLKQIAQDLRLSYETVKSYSKWARKELETGEVRQK